MKSCQLLEALEFCEDPELRKDLEAWGSAQTIGFGFSSWDSSFSLHFFK